MMTLSNLGRNITKTTSAYRCRLIAETYKNWLRKDDKVLDIGCGNGIITNFLKQYFEINIKGCDIKNYLIYKVPFIKIVNNQLPYTKKVFNVALLNDVLHHVTKKEQEELIRQATKVADRVLIFEAEPTSMGKIADIVLNKFHYGDLNAPLTFRSIEDWQKLFKKMSLKSKEMELKKPFWYPFSHIAFELQKV